MACFYTKEVVSILKEIEFNEILINGHVDRYFEVYF